MKTRIGDKMVIAILNKTMIIFAVLGLSSNLAAMEGPFCVGNGYSRHKYHHSNLYDSYNLHREQEQKKWDDRGKRIGFKESLLAGNVEKMEEYLKADQRLAHTPILCDFAQVSFPLPMVIVAQLTDAQKIECAQILLKYKANINHPTDEPENPMILAVNQGNEAMLRWLHGAGAQFITSGERSLLNFATLRGHQKIIHFLLEIGVQPSPCAAVVLDDVELLDESLRQGADINTTLCFNENALSMALKNTRLTMVQELLKRGATPTACAAAAVGDIKYLHEAYTHNANLNGEVNFTGKEMSALEIAQHLGHLQLSSELIRLGANIDFKQSKPLKRAIKEGNMPAFTMLIEANANIHAIDKKGRSLAMLVLNRQIDAATQVAMLQVLISKKANLEQADGDGNTIVVYAIKLGRNKNNVLALLLKANAPCDQANNDGITPIHIASASRNKEAVKLLKHAKAKSFLAGIDSETESESPSEQENLLEGLYSDAIGDSDEDEQADREDNDHVGSENETDEEKLLSL